MSSEERSVERHRGIVLRSGYLVGVEPTCFACRVFSRGLRTSVAALHAGRVRRGRVAPGRPLAAGRGARGELGALVRASGAGVVDIALCAVQGVEPVSGFEPEPSRLQDGCSSYRATRAGPADSTCVGDSCLASACLLFFSEPVSGFEPDPPAYETGAPPLELRGQVLAVRASPSARDGRAPARAAERFLRSSVEAGSFQTRI